MCEGLLATLRFAVARVDSVDKAVSVISTLMPDVIVARAHDVTPLQRAAWPSGVAFVTVTESMREPAALIEAIRRHPLGADTAQLEARPHVAARRFFLPPCSDSRGAAQRSRNVPGQPSGISLAMVVDHRKESLQMRRTLVLDTGLDKLQELLLGMTAGDEVSVPHAVAISGLRADYCAAVLEALTRAGLMTRLQGDAYVRRHLAD